MTLPATAPADVTPSTAAATSDPMQPCARCDLVHVTSKGAVSCRGHKRSGPPCTNPPMHGQLVCRMHGGSSPQARTAASRRLALGEAMAELDRLGRPLEVEPAEAMLAMVYEAAGNVALYRQLVQRLRADVDQGAGVIEGNAEDGPFADDIDRSELGGSIASRVDPANWKAAPHVWVVMYDAERERLVRWAKACRDAGVDERQVQLAEADGRRIVAVLLAGFDALFALLEGDVGSERLVELRRDRLPLIVRQAIETTGAET